MPRVLPPFKGLRIIIFTHDHLPPHVHVVGPDATARFELLCRSGVVRVMDSIGYSDKQIREIASHLTGHVATLCQAWRNIHG